MNRADPTCLSWSKASWRGNALLSTFRLRAQYIKRQWRRRIRSGSNRAPDNGAVRRPISGGSTSGGWTAIDSISPRSPQFDSRCRISPAASDRHREVCGVASGATTSTISIGSAISPFPKGECPMASAASSLAFLRHLPSSELPKAAMMESTKATFDQTHNRARSSEGSR
jgi:hypothetical protein